MGVTSCYSDFDEPAPAKVWTAADFESEGCQLISIKELKDMCANVPLAGYKEITEDYVIKGKVISSDQAGNVYKSVYIYDGTAGIELKLMVSNYVYYQVGQTLYVKLKGLAIGNYRYMLSVGGIPTAEDISKTMPTVTLILRWSAMHISLPVSWVNWKHRIRWWLPRRITRLC